MDHRIASILGVLTVVPALAVAQPRAGASAGVESTEGPVPATASSAADTRAGSGADAPGSADAEPAPAAESEAVPTSAQEGSAQGAKAPPVASIAPAAATPSREDSGDWTEAPHPEPAPLPPRLEGRWGGTPRVHAGIGSAILRHRDSGFALFTENRWTTGVTASAGVDLLRFRERWLLSVDADWSREVHRSTGLFGGNGRSLFNAHTLGIGASLRYDILKWVQPYFHAWGGFAATRARLSVPPISYQSDSARQYLPAFGAALGATVWGPSLGGYDGVEYRPVTTLGLRAEAGYEFTGAFDFEYDLHGTGAYPITVYEPTAGTLRLDAPYIRLLVMLGAL